MKEIIKLTAKANEIGNEQTWEGYQWSQPGSLRRQNWEFLARLMREWEEEEETEWEERKGGRQKCKSGHQYRSFRGREQ